MHFMEFVQASARNLEMVYGLSLDELSEFVTA